MGAQRNRERLVDQYGFHSENRSFYFRRGQQQKSTMKHKVAMKQIARVSYRSLVANGRVECRDYI